MFLAVIVFVVIFGLVVLVHELGHFYFAKRAGIKVEEFGFGLPPRLWGVKRGETIYSINWIPFGGFVRMLGENETVNNKRAFSSKSAGQRAMVAVAGVLMNFVLAFVIMMIGFWFSMPPFVTPVERYVSDPSQVESRVVVVNVVDDSPAQAAGLQPGDYLLRSGETVFSTAEEFVAFTSDAGTRAVEVVISRGGEESVVTVTPEQGDEGVEIGAWIDRDIQSVDYVWWQVPWLALQETAQLLWVVMVVIWQFLYQLFATASVSPDLAGPVGIAKITADLLNLGWLRIVQFTIFLSINLGIINLVPFPALDGGRLLFILIEVIRGGRKVPHKIEGAIHSLGFVLIMLLLLVVTYRDVIKLI